MFDTIETTADVFDREMLDAMRPGPFLGIVLSGLTPRTGLDHVTLLQHHARQVAFHQAQMYEQMIAIADAVAAEDRNPTAASEGAVAEIRVALHLTRRAAEAELTMADALGSEHPEALAALHAGRIDRRRAGAIMYGVGHLQPTEAQAVVAQILDDAAEMTTGQISARLRRLCCEANPDDAKDRYHTDLHDRRVETTPSPDGTVHLAGRDLPPDRVARIRDRINRIAQSLRRHDETRTIDQLRADVFLDLLEGHSSTPNKSTTGTGRDRGGVIDLRVDLATLAELDDRCGDLGGYGPVIADIARQIAGDSPDAEWRFTITDPATGDAIGTGATRRRPTLTQRRRIRTRHRTCVFPGCRMPAIGSDLDHTTPYATTGVTNPDDMAPLCRHDHCVRHQHGWTYTRLPDGTHHWTTKLGQTVTTQPRPP